MVYVSDVALQVRALRVITSGLLRDHVTVMVVLVLQFVQVNLQFDELFIYETIFPKKKYEFLPQKINFCLRKPIFASEKSIFWVFIKKNGFGGEPCYVLDIF
jgi:hypothetical protein